MKKITFISDTHQKHRQLTNDLIGGDMIIHAGDIMTSGYYETEVKDFCEWFSSLNNYEHKIFIAGNHDRLAENNPNLFKRILDEYPNILIYKIVKLLLMELKSMVHHGNHGFMIGRLIYQEKDQVLCLNGKLFQLILIF